MLSLVITRDGSLCFSTFVLIMGFLHLLMKENDNLCVKGLNFNLNIFQHFNIFR